MPPTEQSALVERVKRGDQDSEYDLYCTVREFVRTRLRRLLGSRAEDLTHDVFIAVLMAVRSAELRDGNSLRAFATTIAMRLAWTQVYREKRLSDRPVLEFDSALAREDGTFDAILLEQRRRQFRQAIASLASREQEIMHRFYVRLEPADLIREQMRLSETQYRLLKSRAKRKCERWVSQTKSRASGAQKNS